MTRQIFLVTMALFSFQLQADALSRRDAAKKQFVNRSQEELSLQQSQVKKIESDKDPLSLHKKSQIKALVAKQVEKNKTSELKPENTRDQDNKSDVQYDYSEILKSKMRTVLVAIGLQEHDENKKSEKITQRIVQLGQQEFIKTNRKPRCLLRPGMNVG